MGHRNPIALIGIVLLLFTGCETLGVATPETPREKLLAAETSYLAAAQTITDLAERRVIQGTAAHRVKAVLLTARNALNLWHLDPDNLSRLRAAQAAVLALQGLLNTFGRQ